LESHAVILDYLNSEAHILTPFINMNGFRIYLGLSVNKRSRLLDRTMWCMYI